MDLVFICDTWHHIAERPHYLTLLHKALRPGGRVAIVDYQKKETAGGPPMEMRLSREAVLEEFGQGGFRLAKEHTFLPNQYFLVFEAAPAPR